MIQVHKNEVKHFHSEEMTNENVSHLAIFHGSPDSPFHETLRGTTEIIIRFRGVRD